MFSCALWFLSVLCKTHLAGGHFMGHTQIIPHTPFIQRGSNITLFCILDNSTLIHTNASHIFWRYNENWIPGERSTVVNETVSSVTIHNVTAANVRLTCGINNLQSPQILHQIYLQSGFPPETPKNISCVYYNKANFTCTWIPGKETHLPTNYTLTRIEPLGKSICVTRRDSCSFLYPSLHFAYEYKVQVKAENALGNATTNLIAMDSFKLVKMEAPEVVSVESILNEEPSLGITWKRPLLAPDMLPVKCSLRYRKMKNHHWGYHHDIYMEKKDKIMYNLTGLVAFTEYTTSLRCIGTNGQILWSEWSAEKTGRTAEKVPSHKVDLWRVIDSPNGNRSVHLKWKETSNLGYKVKWFPEDCASLKRTKTTTQNEITLNVSGKAYVMSVVSYNSAGTSPEATLRIPAIAEKPQNLIANIQILKREENMTVKWNTTGSIIHRFVVEWCIDSYANSCNISWQYVENSTEWTSEQGMFEPYRCYNISIYPLVEEKVESPSSIQVYFKEGSPLHGPNAKTQNLGKTKVTLKWEAIPKDERNGVITNYTVVYKPLNGKESAITVDSNTYEYTLNSLMPNTLYTAYVVASNQEGMANGNHIHFSTPKYNKEDIAEFIVSIGMCILLVTCLGITCAHKNHKLKRFFWPDVPTPAESSMADWPSDWPQMNPLLNSIQSEGIVNAGDVYILHALYLNEKAILLEVRDEDSLASLCPEKVKPPSNIWDCKEQCTASIGSAHTQYPAAAASADHKTQASLSIISCEQLQAQTPESGQADNGPWKPLLCDLFTNDHEQLDNFDLCGFSEEIAVNPYLQNSTKTTETIVPGDNVDSNNTASRL